MLKLMSKKIFTIIFLKNFVYLSYAYIIQISIMQSVKMVIVKVVYIVWLSKR